MFYLYQPGKGDEVELLERRLLGALEDERDEEVASHEPKYDQ